MSEVITLDTPVPFGKYKDQPVAVMMGDQQYVNWCLMQSWFGEKYATLAAVLQGRNTLEQDACTPEHNSLQMLFLRPEYQNALRKVLYPDSEPGKFEAHATHFIKEVERDEKALASFKEKGQFYDARNRTEADFKRWLDESKQNLEALKPCCHQPAVTAKFDFQLEFEENNWDIAIKSITRKDICECGEPIVQFSNYYGEQRTVLVISEDNPRIELKPSISEDYPAILRKVKSRMGFLTDGYNYQQGRIAKVDLSRKIVITREITATTATAEEIKQMFKMSGVELILLSEIEALL